MTERPKPEPWQTSAPGRSPRTETDYRYRLEEHLLPPERGGFRDTPIDQIDYAAVERYIAAKRAQRLGPRTINKQVTLLARILEVAIERELIGRNPAKGDGRRVRQRAPKRTYIDSAEGIAALLEAAGRQQGRLVHRRAILAVLIFTGLRISELCSLRWRHVDLPSGWLPVGEAKTDAGVRRIKLRPILREELATIRPIDADPNAFVFGTKRNKPPSQANVGSRVLQPAVEEASARLVEHGFPPLPDQLTPHSMRRTFTSVLFAIGETPPTVMAELGHADAAFTLSVYAQGMRRDEDEKAKLVALVEGVWANDWANEPASAPDMASESQT